MKKLILIIEDDIGYQTRLKRELERNGYRVIATSDGDEGVTRAKQDKPNLIILDLRLESSRIDGWEVCKHIRATSHAPILILTGNFLDPNDIVRGLELGADEYVFKQNVLRKPISLKELLARVRATIRRTEWEKEPTNSYTFNDVTMDFKGLQTTKAGKPVKLRPIEYGIMRLLIEHEGEPVSRELLLNEVWGYDRFPTTRTVDTHIHRLRRLLEDDPSQPRHIITVTKVGYRFEP